MVEATPSLSPKEQERIRNHRAAVMTLAMREAKRSVVWQLRARGEKVNQYSARDLALMAAVELELNPRFIAVAVEAINTWPGFAHLRLPAAESVRNVSGLRTLAQPQTAQCEENRT